MPPNARCALELQLFEELRQAVLAEAEAIAAAGSALAVLDVSLGLAKLARERDWCRPVVDDSLEFSIDGGRHPVVEPALRAAGQPFIANSCNLSPKPENAGAGSIVLLTGPNMGGKSTYLRQNALILILAQAGCYVPARSAHIGLADRLFSRVGAADDLAAGRSTFMVEMIETAAILNQASERSLVILDEIGRGTATFDGLSIAWATIEHLHEVNRSRTLFATHFHELTSLAGPLARLENATMRVKEWQGEVVFLHEVIAGAADRSYGIQVARLAGLPESVIARARNVLEQLESAERARPASRLIDDLPLFSAALREAASKAPANHPVLAALAEISPDELSPREALVETLRTSRAAWKPPLGVLQSLGGDQILERDAWTRPDLLDHLGGGEGADPRRADQIAAMGDAEQKPGGKQIAGAGGVDQSFDRPGRYRVGFVARQHDAALFRAGNDGGRAIVAQRRQRRVEGGGLVERFDLRLVGEDEIDRAGAHQIEELVAIAVDAERIRQRHGETALVPVGNSGGKADGVLGARRVPQIALEIGDAGRRDDVGVDILGAEFDAGAEIGVHRTLAVRGDEDHRARRRRRAGQRPGRKIDADGADIVAYRCGQARRC